MQLPYQSHKFKTTIGEGYCWTDNSIVRVVADDQYGQHVFRLMDAEQVAAFRKSLDECEAVAARIRKVVEGGGKPSEA